MEDDRPSAQPEILGKANGRRQEAAGFADKKALNDRTGPAALAAEKIQKRHCRSNKNKEIDYDEKNGILTFLFAFCPGAGQMYQGYMKRGLSLITMFCVAFGARGTLLEVLVCSHAHCVDVQLLDTFNLRAQIGAGTAPQDDYLVHINWHDQRMEQFMLDSHKLLGWGPDCPGRPSGLRERPYEHAGRYPVALGPEQPLLPCTLPDDGSAAGGWWSAWPLIICGVAGARPRAGRSRRTMPKILPSILHRMRRQSRKKGLCHAQALGSAGKPVTPDDETEDADDGRDENDAPLTGEAPQPAKPQPLRRVGSFYAGCMPDRSGNLLSRLPIFCAER